MDIENSNQFIILLLKYVPKFGKASTCRDPCVLPLHPRDTPRPPLTLPGTLEDLNEESSPDLTPEKMPDLSANTPTMTI